MRKNIFYMVNLFACVGIGACNGVNFNRMNKRDKNLGSTSNSSVSRSLVKNHVAVKNDNKTIRKKFVVALEERIKDKFNVLLPEAYKSFLIEQSESILDENSLGPFNIFSFVTPKSESDINPMVSQILKYWLAARNSMLAMERFTEKKAGKNFGV